ncbi:MAG TPA: endonuclease III [Blastocatellia bacterium]|nr:endonuclease III [Blastocatellia bacterium]
MSEEKRKLAYAIQNLEAVYGIPKNDCGDDPLDELIATILSQATTNQNSHRTFANLKRRFPDWEMARKARASSIEREIKLGGLARQKSLRIKAILNQIYEQRGNLDLSFLRDCPVEEAVDFLSQFSGVGPKTIGCVLLFACKRSFFPMDVHIFRIARRLNLISDKCSDKEAHEIMGKLIPRGKHYSAHINLIRHGRKVCRPRNPKCEDCCLVEYCEYQDVI